MRQIRDRLGVLALASMVAACGSNNGSGTTTTTGTGGHAGGTSSGGGGSGTGGTAPTCTDGGSTTGISHVVIVIQENHTFDTYFGNWCTAATGSAPTCTAGPSCCEAAPAMDPTGASPVVLDDAENGTYDPNHAQACELGEIDMGMMDGYVTGSVCADPHNFAYAPASLMKPYQDLATQYAVADRYFQSIAGQSTSNDMYLAVAQEVFIDNAFEPDAPGSQCEFTATKSFTGMTIADLLQAAGKTVAWYSEGWAAMVAAGSGGCPSPGKGCGGTLPAYPCVFDPGDVPFLFYPQFQTSTTFMRDYTQLQKDLDAGTLPDVSYVKGYGFHSEHPGTGTKISDGETFVTGLVQAVEGSCYKDTTLVLVTWDEGGGFFDHVAPPADSTVDNQPYGTRVPLLAIGRFAAKGAVSHTTMEHSSIVKFLEWNYLDGQTGQLGARDAVVNNIGSMLDPNAVGSMVPDQ